MRELDKGLVIAFFLFYSDELLLTVRSFFFFLGGKNLLRKNITNNENIVNSNLYLIFQEPLVNDEEFVSKEDLATVHFYFKRPGCIRSGQVFFYTGIRKFYFNETFTNKFVSSFFLDGCFG